MSLKWVDEEKENVTLKNILHNGKREFAGIVGVVAPFVTQVITHAVTWREAVALSVGAAVTYILADAHVANAAAYGAAATTGVTRLVNPVTGKPSE